MANTLGIVEVTMAQALDIDHAVNSSGDLSGSVPRNRWNQRATIRVTDHPSNDAGETGDDTSKMALFTSRSQGNMWVLGGANIGVRAAGGVSQPTTLLPV